MAPSELGLLYIVQYVPVRQRWLLLYEITQCDNALDGTLTKESYETVSADASD